MGRLKFEPPRQQELFKPRGGKRPGAGRPRKQGRASEKHQVRERFAARHPIHVNIRVDRAVGQLRRWRAYKAFREAMRLSLGRDDFRLLNIGWAKHGLLRVDHVPGAVEVAARARRRPCAWPARGAVRLNDDLADVARDIRPLVRG